jgi:hypothetical protein
MAGGSLRFQGSPAREVEGKGDILRVFCVHPPLTRLKHAFLPSRTCAIALPHPVTVMIVTYTPFIFYTVNSLFQHAQVRTFFIRHQNMLDGYTFWVLLYKSPSGTLLSGTQDSLHILLSNV